MKKLYNFIFLLCTAFLFAQVPSNDTCGNALAVALPSSGSVCFNSSNLNATSDNSTNLCDTGAAGNEVWYTFIASNANNTITITPNGATPITDAVVTLITSGCASGTYDVCNAATGNNPAISTLGLIPGTQVWFSVESNGTDGTFQVCIDSVPPAATPGNTCATATNICDKSNISVPNLTGFTASGIQPTCFGLAVRKDVWIKFTVGVTGTLEFLGTPIAADEYDWALYDITDGCLGTLVSCNYNFASGNTGPVACGTPGATFGMLPDATGQPCPAEFNAPVTVIAGRTYALLIDNFSITDNGFDLQWGGTFQMGTSAIFTVDPQSSCAVPLTVNITNNSVGAVDYLWNFGDGTTSTSPNPGSHTYTATGDYLISLTVTGNGCTSVISQRVNLNTGPVISVTPSSATICPGESVLLNANLSLGTSFNDRQFSSAVNTAIPDNNTAGLVRNQTSSGMINTTLTPGSVQSICFTINHTSHSDIGRGPTPDAVQVTVNGNTYNFTPLPLAAFSGTRTYCFPQTVLDAIAAAGGPSNTTWTLKVADNRGGGGGTGSLVSWQVTLRDFNSIVGYSWSPTTDMINSTTLSPTVSPSVNTTYVLSATDLFGCTTQFSVPIVIGSTLPAPTASVTVQPTCAIPTGTIVVTAPTGASIQYSIGGAYQSSGTFSGLAPGSYNVTAQDTATGCTSVATVLVVNPPAGAPDAPTASVTVQPTCTIPTGTIVVTAPTGASIQYSIGGAYQSSGTFSGLAPGSYNVTAQDTATGCISSATVLVVNPIPANPDAPTASVTVQPTCTTPTGTIVVTAPTGASIQYSIGGAYQSSGTFAGLAAGSYNVTAQDTATGCISSVTVLVVNPIPANPDAPTASVTVQPTCTTPTGTIVVTAPTGASIQYSIGGAYQSSGTFAGLAAGSYNVTAQDTATGCISSATVLVVNPIPANPDAPTASVTVQPTCTTPTGTIVVTAPTGASIQYSIGGAYQSSGTFSGLAPGSYNVTAQDTATGCISSATVLVVNPIPANPDAPTASVTVQPTCTTPTGTIVVTAPTGASIQYSIGGAYQSSGTFAGLAAGSYNVTAQDTATGCISSVTVVVVNPPAGAPDAPTASVTVQPTCTIPTGTIVVTAPTGASIQYSIGGAYQSSGTFSGLAPGSYNVTAQDTATGCTSSVTVLVVNPIPANPDAPTASVTVQPTCTIPTGTIVVTAPTGASIQYSIGGAYQSSGTFAGLAAGSYNVTAQDTATGCISSVTVLVVNPIPANPDAPTASVTVQPTCTTPTGTIVVTAPTGASIQYSIGGAYQSSGTFAGLAAGSYNVTAQDTATGCISSATVLVVNPIPANPDAPTASVTVQPTCTIPTGTIVVTAPTGASIQYSIGGAYQSSGTFAGLAAGSYNVTAQDTATGCISSATVLVVNPIPANPDAPTASVTVQPTCTTPTGTIVVTAPTGASIQYSIGGAYQSSGTFAGLAAGSYNVTAQDTATGCISSATVLVVNPIPTGPSIATVAVTQPSCAVPTATILVISPIGANLEYSINNGVSYQTSTSFSGLAPSLSYTIIVRDVVSGCISSPSSNIIVDAVPASPIVTLSSGCNGSSYEIVASTTSSSATYQWYSGSTLIGSTSTVVISNTGTYQVDVTVDGCTTTEFVTIDNVTCSIPKGISPNGDGLNDSWDISGLNARKVQIFNRYGVEVYSRPNYTNEFEGKTNNGNELPTGTYYYVITLDNGAKTGWLYINRAQ
jgi:gliding motility-associated-like protein